MNPPTEMTDLANRVYMFLNKINFQGCLSIGQLILIAN